MRVTPAPVWNYLFPDSPFQDSSTKERVVTLIKKNV